jgi:ABC-type polysaccharide/polyol phosphate transport system ATPase subunit
MTEVDVRLQEVSKDYRLGVRGRASFSALKDVTLDMARAESFGVIGRNGA